MRTVPVIAATALAAVAARQAREQAPFLRMLGSIDRRARRRRLGHRLPQRRVLPPRRRTSATSSDLRLALTILTTRWHRLGHRRLRRARRAPLPPRVRPRLRLRTPDGRAARARSTASSSCSPAPSGCSATGSPEADADAARRGWGIAFETVAERDALRPEQRLRARAASARSRRRDARRRDADLAHLPAGPAMPSADAVVALLTRPETWPDFASELGRFTPLRPGGLAGQTFEIEVAAGTRRAAPGLHPRLRDDHDARHARRRPRGCASTSTSSTTAWSASARRAARRSRQAPTPLAGLRPHDARGPLHGRRPQPPRALRAGRRALRCAPRAPGTRCRGPSTRPTGARAATRSTRFWGEGDAATAELLHQIARYAGRPQRVSGRRGRRRQRARTGWRAAIALAEGGRTCSCSRPRTASAARSRRRS